MKPYCYRLVISAAALLCLIGSVGWGRGPIKLPEADGQKSSAVTDPPLAHELRRVVVHDAGALYTPIMDGKIGSNGGGGPLDPETGNPLAATTYPQGSGNQYVFIGAPWVGGIVGEDTLVTVGFDGWFFVQELNPQDRDHGGAYRRGQYADDEFVTTLIDTAPVIYVPEGHNPLGIEVELVSYSWADTLYDDFVILDCVIRNIGGNHIREGWVGFYMDNDIYHESNSGDGWTDDFSGALDTLLYPDDPSSRVLIPYSADNDGDATYDMHWDTTSIRGVISLMYLGSSFAVEHVNFNWWYSNGNQDLDFGARRLGTPEDPFRPFLSGNLGTPVYDVDKYYILSHPEVDYNQLEIAVHDSSNGWVPYRPYIWYDDLVDTRFFYSFGPFDLPAGDSATFAVALVAAEGLHVDPRDYWDDYDPLAPEIYESTLDFSQLILHLRRADSVYRSGYQLPVPGPPVGLAVTDYDDSYVDVVWNASHRPDLAGYCLYIKDTTNGSPWWQVSCGATSDTTGTVPIFEPAHIYHVAVSVVDSKGRESARSTSVTVLPGAPHPPESLSVTLDGLIPQLSWQPHVDTALQVFLIYRAVWEEPYGLYDSTAALMYRDIAAESGVQYHYRVSAKNDLNLESSLSGPVTAQPMAMDQGILFYNLNRFNASGGWRYLAPYVDRLYESVASVTRTTRLDTEDGDVTFKQMADYSLVIADASSILRLGLLLEDSLANYFLGGGRLVLIKPSLEPVSTAPKISRYGDGNFYHDFLKLDSSVTPAIVLYGSGFAGDLMRCEPLRESYPRLDADAAKLAQAIPPITGYYPLCGWVFPTEAAEPIYSYVSSNPDTTHQGMINGIRYLGNDYGFVLLCLPLSGMKEQDNMHVLRQALIDLGVDMNCGDANDDGRTNIGDAVALTSYLYRGGAAPADWAHADANGDTVVDVGDVVAIVNYIFKGGWLSCGT